jgi:hypothetical protein
MIAGLNTAKQGPFCLFISLILWVPVATALITQQQRSRVAAESKMEIKKQNQEDLDNLSQQIDQDTLVGLERAKNCTVLDTATPLGQSTSRAKYKGTIVYLPTGTNLCDRNGFTAVQGQTSVIDIRPISKKTLETALKGK